MKRLNGPTLLWLLPWFGSLAFDEMDRHSHPFLGLATSLAVSVLWSYLLVEFVAAEKELR